MFNVQLYFLKLVRSRNKRVMQNINTVYLLYNFTVDNYIKKFYGVLEVCF